MGWKVSFSPQALEDLAAAVRYIARDDPAAAERIGNALIDRVLILEMFPKLGPAYPKREGVRTLMAAPYIIYYRTVGEERVEILRYWHAARGTVEWE